MQFSVFDLLRNANARFFRYRMTLSGDPANAVVKMQNFPTPSRRNGKLMTSRQIAECILQNLSFRLDESAKMSVG